MPEHPVSLVTHRRTVTADMIDHLGHMNVRYYGECARAGTAMILETAGIPSDSLHLVDVYTRLAVDEVRFNGDVITPVLKPELGYTVTSLLFDVASGGTAELELSLSGILGAGGYQLFYRPQPLPNPDQVTLEATTTGGNTIFRYEGQLERRTVVNASGVGAYR